MSLYSMRVCLVLLAVFELGAVHGFRIHAQRKKNMLLPASSKDFKKDTGMVNGKGDEIGEDMDLETDKGLANGKGADMGEDMDLGTDKGVANGEGADMDEDMVGLSETNGAQPQQTAPRSGLSATLGTLSTLFGRMSPARFTASHRTPSNDAISPETFRVRHYPDHVELNDSASHSNVKPDHVLALRANYGRPTERAARLFTNRFHSEYSKLQRAYRLTHQWVETSGNTDFKLHLGECRGPVEELQARLRTQLQRLPHLQTPRYKNSTEAKRWEQHVVAESWTQLNEDWKSMVQILEGLVRTQLQIHLPAILGKKPRESQAAYARALRKNLQKPRDNSSSAARVASPKGRSPIDVFSVRGRGGDSPRGPRIGEVFHTAEGVPRPANSSFMQLSNHQPVFGNFLRLFVVVNVAVSVAFYIGAEFELGAIFPVMINLNDYSDWWVEAPDTGLALSITGGFAVLPSASLMFQLGGSVADDFLGYGYVAGPNFGTMINAGFGVETDAFGFPEGFFVEAGGQVSASPLNQIFKAGITFTCCGHRLWDCLRCLARTRRLGNALSQELFEDDEVCQEMAEPCDEELA